MQINDKYYNEKKEFVEKLNTALNFAKPHLTCEFKLGEEVEKIKGVEYVVVTARNGYQYFVNVTANSLAAVGEEVFRAMVAK